MKKIFELFLDDLKRVTKSKIAVVILIGMLIIPGIYAWLNIDSNWGPYDNTGNIPVAIVNQDEGTVILGEKLNLGDEIENNLKDNKGMKWIFTNYKDARKKVDQGKYYGAIVIPKNFSQKLVTVMDENEIEKPKFDFYVNNKKNAIAPIIVNKAVGTIQTSVNQTFVNTVVYKVMEKAENLDIISKSVETTDDLVNKLEDTKIKVQQLRTILQTANLAAGTTEQSLAAVRALIPNLASVADTTKQGITDMKNAAQSFDTTYESIEKDLTAITNDIESIINDSLDIINKTDSTNAKDNLEKINTRVEKALTALRRLDNTLTSINSVIELKGIQALEKKVNEQIKKLETLQNKISDTNQAINDLDDIKKQINDIHANVSSLKSNFQNEVKPELSKVYKKASEAINNAAGTLASVNGSLSNVDSSMQYIMNALVTGSQMNNSIDIVLQNFQDDIDKLINIMRDTKHSELYNNIVNLLKNKPDEVADFISSPIDTNQIELYPISTYGSKMTPFYSVLACWVGCTLLTSILKVDIKKTRKNSKVKPYQFFFGRFMLFGLIAMLQGLVIGLGDLFLQVQTANWFLFLLTLMLSSLVFVLIIYSLTITFGKVGQALAIVIMVLQVAGSGGTFPVELLPRGFQLLQPFMPFHPAMNAARETIGGFYNLDYLHYILILLCHTIIPLLLGLVVRNFTMDIKEKVEEELENTNVIA